jgi:hypothetical protein
MFGADAAICGICAFHDDCGKSAKELLTNLSQHIEVGNVGSMHVSSKPTIIKEKVAVKKIVTSESKLTKLVNQILKAAPDFKERILLGENPFSLSAKPAYFKPCVDVLLSSNNETDRLIRLLVLVFNKSQSQAEKDVALFLSAIEYIKEHQ